MKKIEDYKVLKIIKKDNDKEISIIEVDKKKLILKKVISNDIDLINMLKNEIRTLKILADTDVVPKLIDYNLDEGKYLIMELIKGVKLNELVNVSFKDKVILILKIIDTLNIVHKLGIIHCDLKPDNIILDINNHVKLIDFGISSNGATYFSEYGTIEYSSKSQLLRLPIDETTDLYSIGIVFYELVFGKNPFGNTKSEIIDNKKNDVYEITTNDLLNLIFSKLFDSKNDRKYMNLEEFKEDLKLFL